MCQSFSIIFIILVCNRGDTIQYQGCLWSRELGQAPMLQLFLTPRQSLKSHLRQQMVWLYWLQDRDSTYAKLVHYRQHAKLVHYQPSYNTARTQWNSDPLMLADGTLRCGMYPAGKVAISGHLATPHVSPVWPYCWQAQCLPFAWITRARNRPQPA